VCDDARGREGREGREGQEGLDGLERQEGLDGREGQEGQDGQDGKTLAIGRRPCAAVRGVRLKPDLHPTTTSRDAARARSSTTIARRVGRASFRPTPSPRSIVTIAIDR
jgi:hypothetical protein